MTARPEKSDQHKLAAEIIARSEADTWYEAKLEWTLESVFYTEAESLETCLCGHWPIRELCELANSQNGNRVIVGNRCVKHFLGLPSDRIFSAVKRIAKDPLGAINLQTVIHARRKGWITDWERQFCLDTLNKRKLSPKQQRIRTQINARILHFMKRK